MDVLNDFETDYHSRARERKKQKLLKKRRKEQEAIRAKQEEERKEKERSELLRKIGALKEAVSRRDTTTQNRPLAPRPATSKPERHQTAAAF